MDGLNPPLAPNRLHFSGVLIIFLVCILPELPQLADPHSREAALLLLVDNPLELIDIRPHIRHCLLWMSSCLCRKWLPVGKATGLERAAPQVVWNA